MNDDKLKNLKDLVQKRKLDSLLISNFYSIYYFTGFKGAVPEDRESYLIFDGEKLNLFAPRLYQNEALALRSAHIDITIVPERNEFMSLILGFLNKNKGKRIGFESEDLKYSEFVELSTALTKGKSLVATTSLVGALREIKVEEEIKLMQKAQEITYTGFAAILPVIKTGITEAEIAEKLKKAMIGLGAQGESFTSIVATNANAALPHYQTSTNKLKKGDLILIDWGALYKGYCGDSTRVLTLGGASERVKKTHRLVVKAHDEGIKAVKSGVPANSVFNAANEVFVKEGLEDKFIHGLGHGIGMAIHEAPSIRRTNSDRLKEGQVFSIEPGLYFKEWGGVRIEDLVVCRKDKAEVLGKFSTDLIEL
ncbi:MAG: Xaa-Pro peptidase family protein [Patescibacteria group bacterium]